MINTSQLPHDQRGFVHKRLISGAIGLLPGGRTALDAFGAGASLFGRGSGTATRAKFTPEQLSGALVHLRTSGPLAMGGLGPESLTLLEQVWCPDMCPRAFLQEPPSCQEPPRHLRAELRASGRCDSTREPIDARTS